MLCLLPGWVPCGKKIAWYKTLLPNQHVLTFLHPKLSVQSIPVEELVWVRLWCAFLQALTNCAKMLDSKWFCLVKPACFDFFSSNFNFQGHILSTGGGLALTSPSHQIESSLLSSLVSFPGQNLSSFSFLLRWCPLSFYLTFFFPLQNAKHPWVGLQKSK